MGHNRNNLRVTDTEPVRILQMIGSLNIGGSQAQIMSLYRAINRERIQFDFIIDHPNDRYYVEEIEKLGGRVYEMPTFKGRNITEVLRTWESFFELHKEYKVLHSHVRSYASLYLPIAKKHGLVTIIHSHSTSNGIGVRAVAKKILQYPLRYQADWFFGCSKEAGEWLFGKRIVNGSKYRVIQNAIDTELYRYDDKIRDRYRKQLCLNTKTTYISVGRLHEAKNQLFLLDVFSCVLRNQKDSVLLIVGDGALKGQLQNRVKELMLEGSVQLLGARSDVPNLLQASDCFLLPSKWEGLPVAVVEAQAAGLQCYISDNITQEVKLSELVHFLPINEVSIWVKEICKKDFLRKNVVDEIISAGFDIMHTACTLENFYLELSKNE